MKQPGFNNRREFPQVTQNTVNLTDESITPSRLLIIELSHSLCTRFETPAVFQPSRNSATMT